MSAFVHWNYSRGNFALDILLVINFASGHFEVDNINCKDVCLSICVCMCVRACVSVCLYLIL